MKIDCVLLNGRVYEKKDKSGKGLSINVLVNADTLDTAQIVNLYSGKAYVGDFDLSGYKLFDKICVEYDQPMGSQYPKLINFSKLSK